MILLVLVISHTKGLLAIELGGIRILWLHMTGAGRDARVKNYNTHTHRQSDVVTPDAMLMLEI